MPNGFAIGDVVKLNELGESRELYHTSKWPRIGIIAGFGKGENTRHCAHVKWNGAFSEDLLHTVFLRKAE